MIEHFIPFRFKVTLFAADAAAPTAQATLAAAAGRTSNVLCAGAFSEVSGLELTMEPKTLQEGGRNWGEIQLPGRTKFSTVILKRGVTTVNDLWAWFDVVSRQANYDYRLVGVIEVQGNADPAQPDASPPVPPRPRTIMKWTLLNALPIKFKGPDLSATANQVAIEELHLVHEGLELQRPVP
ncbi:MAG: phage tail protein [Thiohalocapsa sp.]|uniref:phage tail protein n=1 Tax=Thiohalocapsa sp. TaxID=2497641 RepID=UPI0025CE2CA6|nr:phage tail protein [Thiohalocapsa sp.]MCG6942863.1 phage tail protein [Thiohalocapsa sp.]